MIWLAAWALGACVVVDPGHGGSEAGTSADTLKEKDLALTLAQRVKSALQTEVPDLEVVLTRQTDTAVSLQERAAVVTQKKCALLISMHVNANLDSRLAGFETYYLDTLKARLQDKLSQLGERSLGRKPQPAELIVSDLVAKRQAAWSGELAVRIQREVMTRVREQFADARSNGARHDLLELLAAVEVPAVIVESGYISNPTERARLQNKAYQARIAEGVAAAIKQFLASHPEVT